MPLWGHLSLHVLATFLFFPSKAAVACESPWPCVRGTAETDNAYWNPATALAREARCLAQLGHAPWECTAPANLPSSTTCPPHKHWASRLLRWDKVIGAERGEVPYCNGSCMGKEASQNIHRPYITLLELGEMVEGAAKAKLFNDPSPWLRIFRFNFLRFSSVNNSHTYRHSVYLLKISFFNFLYLLFSILNYYFSIALKEDCDHETRSRS